MKPTLMILAAGMGSRYGGLKQMDAFGPSGEAIIDYSIYDAIRAGFGKVVFIIREDFRDQFVQVFRPKLDGKIETAFVNQDMTKLPSGFQFEGERTKPWGTGHAVWAAKEEIKEPFAVINADDFYGFSALEQMNQFLSSNAEYADRYCTVSYYLKNTLSEHGSVNRGVCAVDETGKFLKGVVERKNIARRPDGKIYAGLVDGNEVMLDEDALVSMNMWGFHPSFFEKVEPMLLHFLETQAHQTGSEFYIPNAIQEMIDADAVSVQVLSSRENWFGVTYPDDKPYVQEQINKLISEGAYPKALWS